MKRSTSTWLVYAAVTVVLLTAMGAVTRHLLRLEAEEDAARRNAAWEEGVRLALWRLENAAPLYLRPGRSDANNPSSPVLPLEIAERLIDAQPSTETQSLPAGAGSLAVFRNAVTPAEESLRQSAINTQEFASRAELSNRVMLSQNMANIRDLAERFPGEAESKHDTGATIAPESPPIRPERLETRMTWWNGDLWVVPYYADAGGVNHLEPRFMYAVPGAELRSDMAAEVADILPHARLLPPGGADLSGPDRRVAAIPLILDPGPTPDAAPPSWSPLRVTVALAWLGTLAGIAALGWLVKATLGLAERRGAFVTAVTHELRTPLTTFKLYTELLTDNLVPPERIPEYHQTLRAEADRLGVLVENVLDYARLERNRRPETARAAALEEFIARAEPEWRARAEAAGLVWSVAIDPSVHGVWVRLTAVSVMRIAANLVDNAGKYAGGGGGRLTLAIAADADRVHMRFADNGPGIPPDERERIFEPFVKARRDAAGTQPGVGLGLALSRRLARSMGGDLVCDSSAAGGEFVLTLSRTAAE